jgi:MinD-like ATPase involved in chromosome partitioning or flagellar assembly
MAEPEVALVFSPEAWVETLHRHLTDHGGARVRQVVMDPSLAFDEEYGTIVVSHRWPALTRTFVDAIHQRRRRILGVFDPDEPGGEEYLASLGVDRVLASDASMGLFVEALTGMAPERERAAPSVGALEAAVDGSLESRPPAEGGTAHRRLIAVGGTPGAGTTEVAIGLATALGQVSGRTVLVDADDVVPSVAQRLGMPIEPNLRSAIESVEYGMGDLDATVVQRTRELEVLCGLPNVDAWSQVRPGELLDVVAALARTRHHVVANVGSRLEDVGRGGRSRYGISRAVVTEASMLIGVGPATPVGVTRLLSWVTDVRALNPVAPVHLVANRAPRDAFRKAEIEQEISRTFQPVSLSFLPPDSRVERAAWAGEVVEHGPYTKAVAELALKIMPSIAAPAGARRSTRRRASGAPVMAR